MKLYKKEEVESIELEKTPYLWENHAGDKVGIIDVRAVVNGNIHVDIEMQMVNQENIEKRILYYWSKLYSNQLKRGENYNKLERTICILFINEEIKEALEKLEEISRDEEKIRIAELRKKYILDQNTNISGAEERGRKQEKIEMAKRMLNKKIDIQTIIDITGLTKEEIENL